MNKQQFLDELSQSLSRLSSDERQDILRDMEEFFHEGLTRGDSEEAVIKKLGSPKKMADTIMAEVKIKKLTEAKTFSRKISAFFAAFFAILLLTPFNLIFLLLPVLLVTFLIIIGWPLVFIIALSLPLIWLAGFGLAFYIGFHLFAWLAILCFAIGWLGLIMAIVVGFSYATWVYFKGIALLFQWNVNFIKNRMKG